MSKALSYVLCFMVGKEETDFGLCQFCLQREERLLLGVNKLQKTPVRNDQQPLDNFLVAL